MWFKACTGDGKALATVSVLAFAAWWTGVLSAAGFVGWRVAATAAAAIALALVSFYLVRRRHWARWIRAQTDDAVSGFEDLLRRRDDHA